MIIKIGDIVQCVDGSYACRVNKEGVLIPGGTSYRHPENPGQSFKVIGIFDYMLPMYDRHERSTIINNVMMVDKDGLTVFTALEFLRSAGVAPEEWPECTQSQ